MKHSAHERTLLPAGRYAIRVPERAPCSKCGGPTCAIVDAFSSGASFGIAPVHEENCPELFCRHGIRWENGCDQCDAEDTDHE